MTDQPEKTPPQDLLDWLGLNAAPNWALARPLGKLFGALLVLIFFAAVAAAVSVLFGTIRDVFWSDDGAGPNLGAGALVTAILGAPFLIWGTIIRHQSLRWQKEGHMTDRISKAVEQLGAEKRESHPARTIEYLRDGTVVRTKIEYLNFTPDHELAAEDGEAVSYGEWTVFDETVPNLEVRIGAILSLERIAQDSTTHDKGRDHVRVMEILCAYIRENSPISSNRPTPRSDIAMAFNVIARRDARQRLVEANWQASDISGGHPDPYEPASSAPNPHEWREIYRAIDQNRGYRLDLRKANLNGVVLQRGNLSGAFLTGSSLQSCIFNQTTFLGANFHNAKLSWTNFFDCNLDACRLSNASFKGTYFFGGTMRYATVDRIETNDRSSFIAVDLTMSSIRNSNFSDLLTSTEQLQTAFADGSVILSPLTKRPVNWPVAQLSGASLTGGPTYDSELAKWRADPASYTPPPPP